MNRYQKLIQCVFHDNFKPGMSRVPFGREEFETAAARLQITLPKNVGDVVYSFRYRNSLPVSILDAAGDKEWIIMGAGKGVYEFILVDSSRILPRNNLRTVKVPDATPEIVVKHALSDEQALLAKVRYNRLIDLFLGLTAYSIQNHLRTTVPNLGQIEIDEVYVAVDKHGRQYILPVQAKGGTDQLSIVQTMQDIRYCDAKFPQLACRAISTQFMDDHRIAMFHLAIEEKEVVVVEERHYKLVAAKDISDNELLEYGRQCPP